MFNTLVGRFGGFAGASRSVVEDLQILVVGGGGAGGHGFGGGNGAGGAGGVAVGTVNLFGATSYTVSVGPGGVAASPSPPAATEEVEMGLIVLFEGQTILK